MSEVIYQSCLQWLQKQKKLILWFSVSNATFLLEAMSTNQMPFFKLTIVPKDSANKAFSVKHGKKRSGYFEMKTLSVQKHSEAKQDRCFGVTGSISS